VDIADELTKKAGPLPVWAWLGIGGGVLLLLLRGGGGGSATASSPATDPNAGGLDMSGLGGGGALDLGAIAPAAPISSIGGDAGGFEDPIADPATSIPVPVGGGSPDDPGSVVSPAPAALPSPAQDPDVIARTIANGQLPGIWAQPGPVADSGIFGAPGYFMLNPLSNTPTFDTFAAGNPDATHVLIQPGDSPAGVLAFATTPQTAQPNGNVVVQTSDAGALPDVSHPSLSTAQQAANALMAQGLTPRAAPGTVVAV
jgi:hypothetical protein